MKSILRNSMHCDKLDLSSKICLCMCVLTSASEELIELIAYRLLNQYAKNYLLNNSKQQKIYLYFF